MHSKWALLARHPAGMRYLKYLAWGVLGLAILVWVAVHSGPRQGEVVVHVTEPDVEVTIAGHRFLVEGRRYDPIVCELPPGQYDLVMRRHGRVLYQESFEVHPRESLVLTGLDLGRDRSLGPLQPPGPGPRLQSSG
jgi:hypothetical protein